MTIKINGRTPEEIKRGLELCIGNSDLSEDYCEKCPYIPGVSCRETLEIDALAYIQQLEDHFRDLTKKVEQLERERDAAVEGILPSKYDARFCPKCGSRTKVISCQQQGAYFVRYRKCGECWFAFKTKEVPVPYEYGEQEAEG